MTAKSKSTGGQPSLVVDNEVVRQIRQHARSSPKTEICGVLIGQERNGLVEVEAAITGLNAEEAGAHVTFTQDTWEHIYKVKDKEFPERRIVGWYHSHPGFGVFLSEHDTFIHKNFFGSPGQVAWVFDPLSDEEGCFGWSDGQIERLSRIAVVDRRGGQRPGEGNNGEPSLAAEKAAEVPHKANSTERLPRNPSDDSLRELVTTFFSHLVVLFLGFLLSWYLFPRVVVMPVDPQTGQPLSDMDLNIKNSDQHDSAPGSSQNSQANGSTEPSSNTDEVHEKRDNAKPR